MGRAGEFGSVTHLVVRFFGALSPAGPSPGDEAWALGQLLPGEQVVWQWTEPTADLLDSDWTPMADRLSALALKLKLHADEEMSRADLSSKVGFDKARAAVNEDGDRPAVGLTVAGQRRILTGLRWHS